MSGRFFDGTPFGSVKYAGISRPSDDLYRIGFIEAMSGTIAAANRGDRSGAVLTVRMPIPVPARGLETAA